MDKDPDTSRKRNKFTVTLSKSNHITSTRLANLELDLAKFTSPNSTGITPDIDNLTKEESQVSFVIEEHSTDIPVKATPSEGQSGIFNPDPE